jgi:hypothetical protein
MYVLFSYLLKHFPTLLVSPFDDGAHPWHPAIMWPQLSACTGVAALKIAVVIPTAPNAAIATIRNMAVFIRDTNKH